MMRERQGATRGIDELETADQGPIQGKPLTVCGRTGDKDND